MEINCKECGHSINKHGTACENFSELYPWDGCQCKTSAQDIAAAAVQSARKEIATLFEDFHTEIMTQTSRGCEGADFTLANEIYLEFLHTKQSLPAEQEQEESHLCGVNYIADDADWRDEQATRESVRPL